MAKGVQTSAIPSKVCRSCGRTITWRKAWARTWDDVRYCSDACRRRRIRPIDDKLGEAIVELLEAQPAGTSICPSAVARSVGGDDWRDLMEPTRTAARRLVADGTAEITQAGRVVDPSTARGPIRIRLTARVVQPELVRTRPRRDIDG